MWYYYNSQIIGSPRWGRMRVLPEMQGNTFTANRAVNGIEWQQAPVLRLQ